MSAEQPHPSETKGATSPTRAKTTGKPRVARTPLPFFSQPADESTDARPQFLLGIDDGSDIVLHGDMRSPEAELPYAFSAIEPLDGLTTARVNTANALELAETIEFTVKMVGGFNTNALEVRWKMLTEDLHIRWFALKTFTGVQVRYILPSTRQPLVFGLAGDDAYAYCDKDPCKDCMFHCKRGFELSVCLNDSGIYTIPIHEPNQE
ncbi:MAG: hypothetical protein RR547_02050 [Raoultibacter sp.]